MAWCLSRASKKLLHGSCTESHLNILSLSMSKDKVNRCGTSDVHCGIWPEIPMFIDEKD